MVRQHQTSDVRLHIGESRDSGFDAEPVIGAARGRTRWHRLGKTRSALLRRCAPRSEVEEFSKRLLLVSALLAGEFHPGRALCDRDAIWRAAFSASSHDPGIALLHDNGLARHAARQIASDRKSTRLNSSHANISYAVFCLKKKKN